MTRKISAQDDEENKRRMNDKEKTMTKEVTQTRGMAEPGVAGRIFWTTSEVGVSVT
jgi:hypothetical protein